MAEIIRRRFNKFFRIEKGQAVSLGEDRPAGVEGKKLGFAMVVEHGGFSRARMIEAKTAEEADRAARRSAQTQPRGTHISVGEAIGEKNGEPVFQGLTGFIVHA